MKKRTKVKLYILSAFTILAELAIPTNVFAFVVGSLKPIHMMDCVLHYPSNSGFAGFNQSFVYTTQMRNLKQDYNSYDKVGYRCTSSKGKKYVLTFDGIGPSLSFSLFSAIKVVRIGFGGSSGNSIGARLFAALGVGASGMMSLGGTGLNFALGVDFAALGIDPSLVRIKIKKIKI